jgi:hypothetical protein
MFSDQQKLGSEPLVCHRSRLASRFLQFNVLQIRRPRRPPARPKLATTVDELPIGELREMRNKIRCRAGGLPS